jgi:hypothetical protein
MSLMSPRAQLMHSVDQGDNVIDRRFRQDAVAQVEDMAGPAAGAA